MVDVRNRKVIHRRWCQVPRLTLSQLVKRH